MNSVVVVREIHWDDIDEDISVNGLLLGIGDKTAQGAEAA